MNKKSRIEIERLFPGKRGMDNPRLARSVHNASIALAAPNTEKPVTRSVRA